MKKPEAPAAAKPAAAAPQPVPAAKPAPAPSKGHGPAPQAPSRTVGMVMAGIGIVAAIGFLALRYGRADAVASDSAYELLQHLTVFVMAIFVGFQVVWNVTPALHTPLMSVTNAISGIIVVGGLLSGVGKLDTSVAVALAATLFATINITGGFIVTRRMLAMFRK
jgi:NAD(P) transhydrogenase subunit alpha